MDHRLLTEIEDKCRPQAETEVALIFQEARDRLGRINCAGSAWSEEFQAAWAAAVEERTTALVADAWRTLAMIATGVQP